MKETRPIIIKLIPKLLLGLQFSYKVIIGKEKDQKKKKRQHGLQCTYRFTLMR